MSELRLAGRFTAEAGHPALPGHFPDNPVLPGVVLLDHVVEAVLRGAPGHRAAGLPAMKFLRPVRPGDRVDILCATPDGSRVAFSCRVDGEDVARGVVLIEARP